MKLFSKLRSVEDCQSSKVEGSKANIVSKVLIESKLKLVVMSKKKGVSQPKM